MTKDTFIDIIECLERQHKKDLEVVRAASVIFPDAFEANLFPDNSILNSLVVKLLQKEFNDEGKDSWIDYYINELGYGAPVGSKVISRKDGTNVPMHNPEDLYNWLIEIN